MDTRRAYPLLLILLTLSLTVVGGCHRTDPEEETEEIGMDLLISAENNVEEELATMLSYVKDAPIRAALSDYVTPIFSPIVHDVDLSFYDQRKGGLRTCRLTGVMDAQEKVFSVRLAASDYRHGSGANLTPNTTLRIPDAENEADLVILQADGTSKSHRAGVFSTRKRIGVREGQSQHITTTLCMNNAVAALIINRDSCEVTGISATFEGMADTFRILDSIYLYDRKTLIKADVVDVTPYMQGSDTDMTLDAESWGYDVSWTKWTKTPLLLCCTSFPSRIVGTDVIGSNVVIWTINLFVQLADGTTTRNDIYIGQPVQAGHLKIIKGWLLADGSFKATPPPPPPPPPRGGAGRPPSRPSPTAVAAAPAPPLPHPPTPTTPRRWWG